MLGWAGLRGAIPIWLATFPVIAGVERQRADLQRDLLRRRHLDPDPGRDLRAARAATRGDLGRAGAAAAADRDRDHPAARRRVAGLAGRAPATPRSAHGQGPRLPREALVNLIVRDGERDPAPRLDRDRARRRASRPRPPRAAARGRGAHRAAGATGPLGEPPAPPLPPRGAPQVFSVRPWTPADGDPGTPDAVEGVGVVARLRVRRDGPGVAGRCSPTAATRSPARPARGRRPPPARRLVRAPASTRPGLEPPDSAWWQEVAGALAPRRRRPEAATRRSSGPRRGYSAPAASAIARVRGAPGRRRRRSPSRRRTGSRRHRRPSRPSRRRCRRRPRSPASGASSARRRDLRRESRR